MKTNLARMIDFFFHRVDNLRCMSTNEETFLVIFALRVKTVCKHAAYASVSYYF